MVLHLLYGMIAGGIFGALVPALPFVSVGSATAGLLRGLPNGVLLCVGAAMFWMNVVLGVGYGVLS